MLTFAGCLEELAREPGRTGVIDDAGRHTWAAIRDEAARLARALERAGAGPGRPVACLMRNRATWIASAVAATAVGALFAPLNTWSSTRELGAALRRTRAVALLAEPEFLGHRWADELLSIEPALVTAEPGDLHGDALPDLRAVVYVDGSHPGALTWADFLGDDGAPAPLPASDAEAPAFVLFTSGSTGEPKGVLLSQHRMLVNARGNAERRRIGRDDRIWLGSPLFYGLGATNALPLAMVTGASLVLADRFDPERALAAIETNACTTFVGTSNMIRRIVETPGFDARRTASLRTGNASIGVAERALIRQVMDVPEAATGYGVTECSGMVTVGDPEDDLDTVLSTVGYPLPGWELRIVHRDDGRVLGPAELGLLEVRGPTALGYLDDPAGTAEAFGPDGWYRTGDLAEIGDDGRLRWRDRVKEIIKTGGIMVSPAEVESLLREHATVAEAYVVGVPDPDRSEVALAVVVPAGRSAPDPDELRGHIAAIASGFKVPAHVQVLAAHDVPRTASGKVDKPSLRSRWIERAAPR